MTQTKSAVKNLIGYVSDYCEKNSLRFTEPRQFVMEIIANAQKPITAYEVLAELAKKIDNPKPPTAYRAIEFLSEHHFIHRIESLNAYVSCHSNHRHQGSQFMVCDECGTVIESHLCHLPDSLVKKASEANFHLGHWNLEIHGSCGSCAKTL